MVLVCYCLAAIALSLLSMHPAVLLVNLICAFSVHTFYLGIRATKNTLKLGALIILPVVLVNLLTNSGGMTTLFRRLTVGSHWRVSVMDFFRAERFWP